MSEQGRASVGVTELRTLGDLFSAGNSDAILLPTKGSIMDNHSLDKMDTSYMNSQERLAYCASSLSYNILEKNTILTPLFKEGGYSILDVNQTLGACAIYDSKTNTIAIGYVGTLFGENSNTSAAMSHSETYGNASQAISIALTGEINPELARTSALYAKRIAEKYSTANIILTGHSRGSITAKEVAKLLAGENKVVTFNSGSSIGRVVAATAKDWIIVENKYEQQQRVDLSRALDDLGMSKATLKDVLRLETASATNLLKRLAHGRRTAAERYSDFEAIKHKLENDLNSRLGSVTKDKYCKLDSKQANKFAQRARSLTGRELWKELNVVTKEFSQDIAPDIFLELQEELNRDRDKLLSPEQTSMIRNKYQNIMMNFISGVVTAISTAEQVGNSRRYKYELQPLETQINTCIREGWSFIKDQLPPEFRTIANVGEVMNDISEKGFQSSNVLGLLNAVSDYLPENVQKGLQYINAARKVQEAAHIIGHIHSMGNMTLIEGMDLASAAIALLNLLPFKPQVKQFLSVLAKAVSIIKFMAAGQPHVAAFVLLLQLFTMFKFNLGSCGGSRKRGGGDGDPGEGDPGPSQTSNSSQNKSASRGFNSQGQNSTNDANSTSMNPETENDSFASGHQSSSHGTQSNSISQNCSLNDNQSYGRNNSTNQSDNSNAIGVDSLGASNSFSQSRNCAQSTTAHVSRNNEQSSSLLQANSDFTSDLATNHVINPQQKNRRANGGVQYSQNAANWNVQSSYPNLQTQRERVVVHEYNSHTNNESTGKNRDELHQLEDTLSKVIHLKQTCKNVNKQESQNEMTQSTQSTAIQNSAQQHYSSRSISLNNDNEKLNRDLETIQNLLSSRTLKSKKMQLNGDNPHNHMLNEPSAIAREKALKIDEQSCKEKLECSESQLIERKILDADEEKQGGNNNQIAEKDEVPSSLYQRQLTPFLKTETNETSEFPAKIWRTNLEKQKRTSKRENPESNSAFVRQFCKRTQQGDVEVLEKLMSKSPNSFMKEKCKRDKTNAYFEHEDTQGREYNSATSNTSQIFFEKNEKFVHKTNTSRVSRQDDIARSHHSSKLLNRNSGSTNRKYRQGIHFYASSTGSSNIHSLYTPHIISLGHAAESGNEEIYDEETITPETKYSKEPYQGAQNIVGKQFCAYAFSVDELQELNKMWSTDVLEKVTDFLQTLNIQSVGDRYEDLSIPQHIQAEIAEYVARVTYNDFIKEKRPSPLPWKRIVYQDFISLKKALVFLNSQKVTQLGSNADDTSMVPPDILKTDTLQQNASFNFAKKVETKNRIKLPDTKNGIMLDDYVMDDPDFPSSRHVVFTQMDELTLLNSFGIKLFSSIDDLTYNNTIHSILKHQFAYIDDPILDNLFYYKFSQKKLLCFDWNGGMLSDDDQYYFANLKVQDQYSSEFKFSNYEVTDYKGITYFSVQGPEQFIKADKLYEVEEDCAYTCSITYRCSDLMRLYFGFISYDKDQDEIQAFSYYRVETSHVVFESFNATTGVIKVMGSSKRNLINWVQYINEEVSESYNWVYRRMIGIYTDIDFKTQRPKAKAVLHYTGASYDINPANSVYTTTDYQKGEIYLTAVGVAEMKRYLNSGGKLIKGKTVLMNHTSGGTYDYIFGQVRDDKEWRNYQAVIKAKNCTHTVAANYEFRTGTRFIRPLILANWNNGYKGAAIHNPQASFDWKLFSLRKLPKTC